MSFTNLMPWSRKKELAPARRQTEMSQDPFALLQNEMNRMFDVFHKDFSPWKDMGSDWMPQVNVAESAKEVTVTAELPGVDEKDVDVSFSNNVLTIRGEKKAEHEEKDKNYHRIERSYGSFLRAVPMPAEIDANGVEAKFAKGVLSVKLPKTREAQKDVKKIAVKGE